MGSAPPLRLSLRGLETAETALADIELALRRQRLLTRSASGDEVTLFERIFDKPVQLPPERTRLFRIDEIFPQPIRQPQIQ